MSDKKKPEKPRKWKLAMPIYLSDFWFYDPDDVEPYLAKKEARINELEDLIQEAIGTEYITFDWEERAKQALNNK